MGTKIKSVTAKEIYARRGDVSLQVTVQTEDGAQGVHAPEIGISVGQYEAAFVFDSDRWYGKGVLAAVNNVNTIIAPKLKGMDVTQQRNIDDAMIELDGTPNKSRLGANAIVAVSIAVLKAAAKSSNLPLYRYLGGIDANIIPCPVIGCGIAGTYRDPGETRLLKPSFEYAAYGAKNFADAVYVSHLIQRELAEIMKKKYGFFRGGNVLAMVKDDRDALAAMTEAIDNSGYNGKVGIYIDCAAGCYYETKKDVYLGIFSEGEKTREDMIEIYKDFVATYPIIILEDPFHEDDFEGHAILTKELGIEIVGDDLFVTNPKRVRKGIELGAANSMVLKVPQIGTISEAIDAINLMNESGCGVHPCGSRGDPSADFAVGFNTGEVRAGNYDRVLEIEEELGGTAKYLGRESFKTKPPKTSW